NLGEDGRSIRAPDAPTNLRFRTFAQEHRIRGEDLDARGGLADGDGAAAFRRLAEKTGCSQDVDLVGALRHANASFLRNDTDPVYGYVEGTIADLPSQFHRSAVMQDRPVRSEILNRGRRL